MQSSIVHKRTIKYTGNLPKVWLTFFIVSFHLCFSFSFSTTSTSTITTSTPFFSYAPLLSLFSTLMSKSFILAIRADFQLHFPSVWSHSVRSNYHPSYWNNNLVAVQLELKLEGKSEGWFFSLLLPTCDIFICDDLAACLFIAPKSNLKLQYNTSLPQAGVCPRTQTFPIQGNTQPGLTAN